jgi:hypothetical protein
MSDYHLPDARFYTGSFADLVAEHIDAAVGSVLIMQSSETWGESVAEVVPTEARLDRTTSHLTENPFQADESTPPAAPDSFDVTVLDNPINDPFKRDYPLRVATAVTTLGGTILYHDDRSLATSQAAEVDEIYAIQSSEFGDTATAAKFTVTHAGSVSAGSASTVDQESLTAY